MPVHKNVGTGGEERMESIFGNSKVKPDRLA